jgi:hypothetical protein
MKLQLFGFASMMMLVLTASIPLHAGAIDSTLYTTYLLESNNTKVNWVVCGSMGMNSGCFGIGNLGPFGRVGAMIEGDPVQNLKNNTVTRHIYVLDVASGSGGNGVALYTYKKVDSITANSDTITVTLLNTITLPLTGGEATVASMAANKTFLYIGTNQDQLGVELQKRNLTVTQFGEGISPDNVTSITADQYGYIAVIWGNGSGSEQFGPNGKGLEEGGGAYFTLNTVQATLPSAIP